MTLDELEEEIQSILHSGYSIETDDYGQIIIYTGLSDDEGELVPFDSEEDEEVDPDLEPLEGEDLEDDD
jgi:hypothetical protein